MNPYELRGRAAKVRAMLEPLPPVASEDEALTQAIVFATYTAEERTAWAIGSGTTEPSPETWLMFLGAIAAREPMTADQVRAHQERRAS